MKLGIIVAATKKGVIGNKGGLPWRKLEGDLERFKKITDGSALVIGRKTYFSIPEIFRELKGRFPIIVTNRPLSEGVVTAKSIEEAIKIARKEKKEDLWFGGGRRIYEEALEMEELERIELTRVHEDYNGDTYLPTINWNEWKLSSEPENMGTHTYLSYRRK